MKSKIRVLKIDASANPAGSNSKKLGDHLIDQLHLGDSEVEIRSRDLNQGLSFIDADWVGANFTPADVRSAAQIRRLGFSDALIEELQWADHIVLTTPMYNFGVPAR